VKGKDQNMSIIRSVYFVLDSGYFKVEHTDVLFVTFRFLSHNCYLFTDLAVTSFCSDFSHVYVPVSEQ